MFSKYHSGFEVIFEISFGEYRILIRRGGYFLCIIRGLTLFVKSNKVNREFSFRGWSFSKYHSGIEDIFEIYKGE